MTAQSSAKTAFPAKAGGAFYKFLPYYLNKLRFLRPQLIMNGIFALLSYPLFLGLLNGYAAAHADCVRLRELNIELGTMEAANALDAAYRTQETMQSLVSAGAIIGILCLIGLFIFTFVTTLRGFRYLYDKNAVDMDYSLPVNHNTRFFGDLAAVFTASILPHLISVLVGIILTNCVIGQLYTSIDPAPQAAQLEMYRSIAVQCMFTGLFACIMQIAFSLLMISVCGKKAEAGLYPVLINIAVPLIHVMILMFIDQATYGSDGTMRMLAISATSPVGMAVMAVVNLFTTTTYFGYGSLYTEWSGNTMFPVFRPEYGFTALALTLAFFAGAYFLIKFRRTERVGMPYVYKGMNVVIPGVVIFTMSLPMCNVIFSSLKYAADETNSYTADPVGWTMGLIISTFIIYVIMELISGKAFRKFYLSVAKWAGTVAVSAAISAVLAFSNGFGMAYYVPDTGSVASSSLSLYHVDHNSNEKPFNYDILNATDPAIIKTITEIHDVVPKDGNGGASDYPTSVNGGYRDKVYNVYITYEMKNGEAMGRNYYVSEELFDEICSMAVTPEVWYSEVVRSFNKQMGNYADDKWTFSGVLIDYQYSVTINDLTAEQILAAIKQDSEKVTYDLLYDQQMFDDSTTVNFVFDTKGDGDDCAAVNITLYPWMENTIALLRSRGLSAGISLQAANG